MLIKFVIDQIMLKRRNVNEAMLIKLWCFQKKKVVEKKSIHEIVNICKIDSQKYIDGRARNKILRTCVRKKVEKKKSSPMKQL